MRRPRVHRRVVLAAMTAVVTSLLGGGRPTALAGQSPSSFLVTVGTHALTVPWYPGPVMDGFDPAVMAGTDRAFRTSGRWTLSFGIDLGFFRDHWWMTGVSVEPVIRFARSLPGGLQAGFGVGLGYLHYFWRRQTLVLRDGRYVEGAKWGRPSIVLPLSATLEYRGDPNRPLSVSPLVSARWEVQGLFLREVPVMSHLSLFGGVRIQEHR